MDIKIEQIRAFGPLILKVQIPEKLVKDLNSYVDQIINDETNFLDDLTRIIAMYVFVSRRQVGSIAHYSLGDVKTNYNMSISISSTFMLRQSNIPHFEEWNFYTGEEIVREYNLICRTDEFLGLSQSIQSIYTKLRDACLEYPTNIFIGSC